MHRLFEKERDIHHQKSGKKPQKLSGQHTGVTRDFANAVAKTFLCCQ